MVQIKFSLGLEFNNIGSRDIQNQFLTTFYALNDCLCFIQFYGVNLVLRARNPRPWHYFQGVYCQFDVTTFSVSCLSSIILVLKIDQFMGYRHLRSILDYTQASCSTASRSTDFQIALFKIGSISPPIALFLVIFTMANLYQHCLQSKFTI